MSRSPRNSVVSLYVLVVSTISLLPTALAVPDDDGFDWLTIGDPGNEACYLTGSSWAWGRGAVDYEYRINRTEVTCTQYAEFLYAYAPFYDGDIRYSDFTGMFIYGSYEGEGYRFDIIPGWEQGPTMLAARRAARYCNWLHNGKVNEQWAFDDGVYDTSTFGKDGWKYTDDYTRRPGAKYWIPTLDEWLKSVYYDPNRDGPDQGGWWRYPTGSDEPPVVGFPADGGETNGSFFDWFDGPYFSVGMYPDVQSPWGLLDTSGGLAEMSVGGDIFGSEFFDWDERLVEWHDRIGFYPWSRIESRPDTATYGLRLGSAIPAPSVVLVFMPLIYSLTSRRERIKRWLGKEQFSVL